MRNKFLLLLLFSLATVALDAQQGDSQDIRVADTLTAQEKNNHNRVILQSEVDSLIKLYNASQVPIRLQEPVIKESTSQFSVYLLTAAVTALFLIAFILYVLFKNQKKFRI